MVPAVHQKQLAPWHLPHHLEHLGRSIMEQRILQTARQQHRTADLRQALRKKPAAPK
jgi:hypothetical protein